MPDTPIKAKAPAAVPSGIKNHDADGEENGEGAEPARRPRAMMTA